MPTEEEKDAVEVKVAEENEVAFVNDTFSIYAVIEEGSTGVEARPTVNFLSDETVIATMYVKNGDDTAEEIERIVYDSGAGTIPAGYLLKCWNIDTDRR